MFVCWATVKQREEIFLNISLVQLDWVSFRAGKWSPSIDVFTSGIWIWYWCVKSVRWPFDFQQFYMCVLLNGVHYKTICSLSSYRWVKLCHPMSLQPMKSWGHWMLIMSWSSLEVWLATQAMTSTSSCGWCASQRGSTPETSGWERRPTH